MSNQEKDSMPIPSSPGAMPNATLNLNSRVVTLEEERVGDLEVLWCTSSQEHHMSPHISHRSSNSEKKGSMAQGFDCHMSSQ